MGRRGGGEARRGRGGKAGGGENGHVLLSEIADVSRNVADTSARLAKIEALAGALRAAGPLEVPVAVAYLSGELPQRQIGVGWASLRDGSAQADEPTLTLSDVDAAFSAIGAVSGKGSTAARKALVGELFGRATRDEQRFLVGLLSGELRQGALEGVMTEAVARAASVPVAEVRRAMMLRGSLGAVAAAALSGGSGALAAFGLEVGRPVRPMLAASAPTIEEALARRAARRQWSAPWSGSSTASGSRPTYPGETSACSPGPSTTSRPGSPRWWRSWPSSRSRARSWTVS